MRIKFKEKGNQRKFFKLVLQKTNCPSLVELINRGISINYSTLKNYYLEERLMPLDLFENLIDLSGIDKKGLDFQVVLDNWGQVIGGRNSKK